MRDFFSFGAAAPSDADAANILVGLSSTPLCLTQSLNFANPENRCLVYAHVKKGQHPRLSKKFCQNCQIRFQVPRNRVLTLKNVEKRSELQRHYLLEQTRDKPENRFSENPDNFYLLRHGNVFVRRVIDPVQDQDLFIAKEDFQDDGFFSLYETESENVSFKISDNKVLLGHKRSGGYTPSGRYAKRTLEQANEG